MRGAGFFTLGLIALWACRDPETAARQEQRDALASALGRGEAALSTGKGKEAVAAFTQATQISPTEPQGYRGLGAAEAKVGNPAAAILALRHALELSGARADPSLNRELVALYFQNHLNAEAERLLTRLEPSGRLNEEELLELTRVRAMLGDLEGARKIAAKVRALHPASPAGRVAEAEVELAEGEEIEAAKHMDALLKEVPGYVPARLLRVRYFLRSGYPDQAIDDLSVLPDELAGSPEVVLLQAQGLSALHHEEDARKALAALVSARPEDAVALAALARSELAMKDFEAAQAHVERALAVDPDCAPALAVRGRLSEEQGNEEDAKRDYEDALRTDVRSVLAARSLWPLARKNGDTERAMQLLEGLVNGDEGEDSERLALATLYAGAHTRPDRTEALLAMVLRREPGNEEALALKRRTRKPAPKQKGIIIIRGGRR